MSKPTEKHGTLADGTAQDAPRPAAHQMLSDDWEERLAVARAQREKVLKAKGKKPSKPKVERPRFLDEDPAAQLGLPRAAPSAKAGPNPTKEASTAGILAPSDEAATLATAFRDAAQSETEPPAKRLAVPISRAATVAFACFFGLGFGMVLSFGAVVAMGWISWQDIAPGRSISEPVAASPAPQIFGNVNPEPLPEVSVNTAVQFRHVRLTPVHVQQRETPRLLLSGASDVRLASVSSPPPRLDATGASNELASQLDFQPATIDVAFENPLRQAVKQALLEAQSKSGDVLPTLPEQSTVQFSVVSASLALPTPDLSLPSAGSIRDVMPVRMQIPSLFKGAPAEAVNVSWAQPEKLEVFDIGLTKLSLTAATDDIAVPDGSIADTLPAFALPGRPAQQEAIASRLPAVGGPPEFKPDLAFRLGFRGGAAERFSLVTFAPANVPNDKMARNAELLQATGFPVAKSNRVNFKVSRTHVRYYNREDESVARAIAAEIGGPARDFTTARNPPPPGRVEIWLKGNRKFTSVASKPKHAVSAAQRNAALKSKLKNRLVSKLRSGAHLEGGSR